MVAHVGRVGDPLRVLGDPLGVQPAVARPPSVVEDARHLLAGRRRDEPDVGLGELVAEVGDEVADRAQQARRRRDDHRERAHQLRDRVGVQRPRAAERDEREVARVVAALHRDEPERAGHVLVDDREDAVGRLLDESSPIASAIFCTAAARRVDVELHLAAEQPRRQVAEDDVRVGHGRLLAALAVGGRAGLGACRLRADAERLRQLRHVGDRAAAGADGVHVDGRAP